MYRNLTQIELETGLQESYLGFPFLEGHIGIDAYIRAPLILFPISIEYQKMGRPPGWYLVFSKEKPTILNRALLALLSKKGRIYASDSFLEQLEELLEGVENLSKNHKLSDRENRLGHKKETDGYVLDDEYYFLQELSQLLITNGFPLRLSEDNFGKVLTLEPISRDEQAIMQRQQLHLVNYKIIGHFPQGDSAIYSDYETMMKEPESGQTNQGIIDNLLEVPSPEDIRNEGNEEKFVEDIDL